MVDSESIEVKVRKHLLKMQALEATGDIEIRIQEGVPTMVVPPPTPKLREYIALASLSPAPALAAMLADVGESLAYAAEQGYGGHLFICVVQGVPVKLLEQFRDPLSTIEARQKPKRPDPPRPDHLRIVR